MLRTLVSQVLWIGFLPVPYSPARRSLGASREKPEYLRRITGWLSKEALCDQLPRSMYIARYLPIKARQIMTAGAAGLP